MEKLSMEKHLQPLFSTRRFLLVHSEFLILMYRLRSVMGDIKDDIKSLGQYLNAWGTGRLHFDIIDPICLRREL